MPSRAVVSKDNTSNSAANRKTTRITLDLDPEQHRFLKLFSVENGIQSSVILRALLYCLEIDEKLANKVIDEIFAE